MQIRVFFSQNINKFPLYFIIKNEFQKKYQIDYYIYSTVINFY